jgi:hypothetical protein
MVQKPHLIKEQFPVLLIDQNHILTVVVDLVKFALLSGRLLSCRSLLASRYDNNHLRASETGGAEDLPTRNQSQGGSHALPSALQVGLAPQWGHLLGRLIDSGLANSRINLLTEKSSNLKSDSGGLRPPGGFAFFRIFTQFPGTLFCREGARWEFRLALGESGHATLNQTWISAGLNTYSSKNGKQNQSIRRTEPESLT